MNGSDPVRNNKRPLKNKTKLKIRNPRTDKEVDAMYRRSFYIGKFMLYEIQDRYDKFVSWIKKCKENSCPIRFISGDEVYDFEIKDKDTGKWIRIGKSTSGILLSSSK